MDIGFIGLGSMGRGMARNLIKAGHRVSVFNRSKGPAEELAREGALKARSAAAVGGEVIVTMLSDDAALESVVLGPGGLASGMRRGAVHLSMSTISVALSDRLEAFHKEAGQGYVAAPVFGRPDAAAAAALFIVAAGDPQAIERARPAMEAMGQRVFTVGDKPSQANLVKLAGNFLITCVIEGLAEAITVNAKAGVAPEKLYEVLTESLFNAPVYRTYGKIILEGNYDPPGFKLPLGLKDNRLLMQAAEALSVPLPFAAVVRDRFLASIARGDGNLDWAAIAKRAAEDAGIENKAAAR
ncbi:MAG TPA: NAD(P)-dependent oxidoreductase [Alphaproteobacteria bacterium]|nr:NAD(P)-dependent oxidoreductase [Alphaproteobacteria bacterium]